MAVSLWCGVGDEGGLGVLSTVLHHGRVCGVVVRHVTPL